MTRPRRGADEPPPPVIIVWAESYPIKQLHTLAYYSGKGHVRVYPRDGYDGRLALGELFGGAAPLPYFRDALEAGAHLAAAARREFEAADAALRLGGKVAGADPFPGMCQVDVRAALELGFEIHELDPHALRHLLPDVLLGGRSPRRGGR